MSRVLVVGGSGFVGSEIVRQTVSRGDLVTVLDITPYENDSIETFLADLTKETEVNKALEGQRFDTIYHTASFPGDTGSVREMMNLNVNGLINILEWAKSNQPNRVVVTGSICSYGWYPANKFIKPKYLPVDEEYPVGTKDIKDMYCSTKRMQELIAMSYYHLYQVPTVVLRLTTVIGPEGCGGGRAWRDFAISMKKKKPAQVQMFSPEEKYHFVDIRDVAEAHIVVSEHPNAIGEIFNIGYREPTAGTDFLDAMKNIDPSIEIEFGYPWSMAQGGKLFFDVSKVKDNIGFESKYNIEDSLRSIKEWVDTHDLQYISGNKTNNKYGQGIKSD